MATILYVHDVSSFGAQSENVTFPKWGISQKIWRGDDILTTREAPMHIFKTRGRIIPNKSHSTMY